jgi:hypothetical protein
MLASLCKQRQRAFTLNIHSISFDFHRSWRILILSLFFASSPVLASEAGPMRYLAPWLPAETLLDNTDRATAPLSPLPGWITSGGTFKNSFGLTFKTGTSEYLIRSVALMVATPADAAGFSGNLKVSLYEVPEGKFPPAEKPFYESVIKGVRIEHKESYVTLQLALPRLKPSTWYGLAFSAPNEAMTRIMGYQIPPRAPTASLGFENGLAIWGEPTNWRSLGYPYLWVEGWDAKSDAFLRLRTASEIGIWISIGLVGWTIYRMIQRRLRG